MKALIADKFPDQYVNKIKTLVKELIYEPKLKAEDLSKNIIIITAYYENDNALDK